MIYDVVIEKKVTADMMDMSLRSLLWSLKNPKIMIFGNNTTTDISRKEAKKQRLLTLIKETEGHGVRFETTQEAMNYLMS